MPQGTQLDGRTEAPEIPVGWGGCLFPCESAEPFRRVVALEAGGPGGGGQWDKSSWPLLGGTGDSRSGVELFLWVLVGDLGAE